MPSRTLAAALLLLMLFKVADYLFTLRAIYVLGKLEANPIADMLLGTPGFFAAKILFPAAGFCLIWLVRDRARPMVLRFVYLPVTIYGALTVYHIAGQWGTW